MTMEHELRRALRSRQPPAGFAERVLARISEAHATAPTAGRSAHRRASFVRLIAGVAALLVLAIGIERYDAHQRQVETEKARQALTVALRIASEKMNEVQIRLATASQRREARP